MKKQMLILRQPINQRLQDQPHFILHRLLLMVYGSQHLQKKVEKLMKIHLPDLQLNLRERLMVLAQELERLTMDLPAWG